MIDEQPSEGNKIVVKIDKARLRKIKLKTWRHAEEANFKAIYDLIATFLIDPATNTWYADRQDAFAVIDEMDIDDVEASFKAIRAQGMDAAVPSLNGNS